MLLKEDQRGKATFVCLDRMPEISSADLAPVHPGGPGLGQRPRRIRPGVRAALPVSFWIVSWWWIPRRRPRQVAVALSGRPVRDTGGGGRDRDRDHPGRKPPHR